MRLKTAVTKFGQIYLPSKVRKVLGLDTTKELEYIANRKTILLLPKGLSAEDALKSIDIIRQDLENEKSDLANTLQVAEIKK